MAHLQKKSLAHPDETRPVGRGTLDVVELGDIAIGRIAYQPGWRWSTDVAPIVGTQHCEVHHVGVVLSGRLYVEMANGSGLELGPDDAFEIPAGHDAWVLGDQPWVSLDSVGRRHFGRPSDAPSDRVLATILFTDIVGSTEMLSRIGDAAWRDLIADLNQRLRDDIERFRGREVATTGDGLLVAFDSPTRAARAALAMDTTASGLGLMQRAGLHTGEVERIGDDLRGVAVHLAARVSALAGAHEVLASSTTVSLLAGSGLTVTSRGPGRLKGIDGEVEIFQVS
jgi:class 3 adenylate cyclase